MADLFVECDHVVIIGLAHNAALSEFENCSALHRILLWRGVRGAGIFRQTELRVLSDDPVAADDEIADVDLQFKKQGTVSVKHLPQLVFAAQRKVKGVILKEAIFRVKGQHSLHVQ